MAAQTSPESKTILLSRFQFCLVRDKNTGVVSSPHEGPKRLQLESHEELVEGVQSKIRLAKDHYCIVANPFDPGKGDISEGVKETRIGPLTFALHHGEKILDGVQEKTRLRKGTWCIVCNPIDPDSGDIREGEREVRVGPLTFPLHHRETIEDSKIWKEYVLTDNEALLLHADRECPSPLDESKTIPAGTELLLKGPCNYIPHKDVTVSVRRKSISLAEAEGVYIQDDDTGLVRLVKGPDDFFLEHNESLWEKKLTNEELLALGFFPQDKTGDSRELAAAPRPRSKDSDAVVVDLEHNETICLFGGDKARVEFGPKTVFFGPHERPKVLFLSGDVPVRPRVLRIAKLGLGPDFIRDKLRVRTRDNASLDLELNFRWRFIVDEEHPEKLFALKDFVGFTAQTLSSEIREEAAKHNFEKFHSEAAALVKLAIFNGEESRVFKSNGLEIFGVDVESITPEDPDIRKKLGEAIKTNAEIYIRRVEEEAELESERLLIEGRKKNEDARRTLIELEVANQSAKALAETRNKIEAERLRAEASAAALRIRSEAEAEALTIRSEAERAAEEARLKVEADHEKTKLATRAEFLAGEAGIREVEIERARSLKSTDKILSLPDSTRLFLGGDNLLSLGLDGSAGEGDKA